MHWPIQVVNHLEHNRQVFEPYMEDDEPFDEYIKRMRCDAEWGGNQELVAASQLYKVRSSISSHIFLPIVEYQLFFSRASVFFRKKLI